MKKRILVICIIIIVIVISGIFIINLNNIKKQEKNEKRYEQIKNDINKEVERYLYFIAPHCSSENNGGHLTHKTLVYNNGFDQEKLLDIDNKSYCKTYIKYKCIEDGKWEWQTYISCKDYTDKGYVDWDKEFEPKK